MNYLKTKIAMATVALMSSPLAWAAVTVPAEFTATKTDAVEATGLAAGAMIAVAAAGVVIGIFVKYVKRFRGAA